MNPITVEFNRVFGNPGRLTAPYARNSATSKAAAKAIAPIAGTQRAIILEVIREVEQSGLTDGEIGFCCQLSGDTVRPRRGELLKAGLIRDSGTTRKTASGRDAVVWVVA